MNNMKKAHVIFTFILLLASCGTSKTTQAERDVKRAERAVDVAAAIASQHFKVSVDHMYPSRGVPRTLNYEYDLRVSGDTVRSFLPYFGRAYSIPYGGGRALIFTATLTSYKVEREKRDMTRVSMKITTSEDTYDYDLEVFDNGNTTIDITSTQREPISFNGEMVLDDDK